MEEAPTQRNIKNAVLRVACLIADWDWKLLRTCHHLDRMMVLADAFMLLLMASIAFLVWYTFFSLFFPPAALVSGLLMAVVIFMLDRRIGSSDWTLAGVLRAREPLRLTDPQWWLTRANRSWRLLIRVSFAFLFATVTAVGMTQVFCRKKVEEVLDKDVQVARADMRVLQDVQRSLVRTRMDDLKSQMAPVEARITELLDQEKQLEELKRQQEEAQTVMRTEMDREMVGDVTVNGHTYERGRGPYYKEAERNLNAAKEREATAVKDMKAVKSRLQEAKQDLAAKQDDIDAEVRKLTALEDKVVSDPATQRHDDPLGRWVAFKRLEEGLVPGMRDQGSAVRAFDHMAMTVLIALELTYLATKVWFQPASVYHVRLVRRVREAAAREMEDHKRTLRHLRTPRRRADMEGWEPPPPEATPASADPAAGRPATMRLAGAVEEAPAQEPDAEEPAPEAA